MRTVVIGACLNMLQTRADPMSPDRCNSPGMKLRTHLGLNLKAFRQRFETINLINERVARWNHRHAQIAARALKQVLGGRHILLIGSRVALAFDVLTDLKGREMATVRGEYARLIAVPDFKQPWWDDNREEFRSVMRTEGML